MFICSYVLYVPPILVGVGKEIRINNCFMVIPEKAAPVAGTAMRTTGPVREDSWQYMYGHTYIKSKDQSDKVANRARGQLNRENLYFPVRVRA